MKLKTENVSVYFFILFILSGHVTGNTNNKNISFLKILGIIDRAYQLNELPDFVLWVFMGIVGYVMASDIDLGLLYF